jgi:hypothetical protein
MEEINMSILTVAYWIYLAYLAWAMRDELFGEEES